MGRPATIPSAPQKRVRDIVAIRLLRKQLDGVRVKIAGRRFSSDDDGRGFSRSELEHAERVEVVWQGGFRTLVDDELLIAGGVLNGDWSIGGAVLVGTEAHSDFVLSGFRNREGVGSRVLAVLPGRVGVVVSDEGQQLMGRALSPSAGEGGVGVVEDEARQSRYLDSIGTVRSFLRRRHRLPSRWERGFFGDSVASGGGRLFEEAQQLRQVAFVDAARGCLMLDAQRCGFADDLANHASGFHDAHGSESLVGDAHATPGHEEVVDVA